MTNDALNAEDAMEKAEHLLETAKTVYMGTNGSHGHPNLRAMAIAKLEWPGAVWFVTDAGSSKTAEILSDSKAVLFASAPRGAGECRLWGHVDILDDMDSKKSVWKSDFKKHFPEGPDAPSLRVLRFSVSNGEYRGRDRRKVEFSGN
jgi:general stress protein 26